MTLAPFLLAAFFGLLISALLHFVLIWPAREPPDGDDGDTGDADAGHASAPGDLVRPDRKRGRRAAAGRGAT
jgi:hypothetical protein